MLEIAFFSAVVGVIAAGVLWLLLATGKLRLSGDDGAEKSAADEVVVVERGQEFVERWSNAQRFAVQLRDVKVRVEHFEYGRVQGRDADRQEAWTETPFVSVWVRVENLRKDSINYRSWQENRFRTVQGSVAAKLSDSAGREYATVASPLKEVRGHILGASLSQHDVARDTLVFAPGEEFDPRSAGPWRLELPAAAWGGEGVIRFEIPSAMLADGTGP